MNQLALNNINTLLNINPDTELVFNKREISINNDENSEHINENNLNVHYSIYFTFNQIFNYMNLNRSYIRVMNYSLDNLYENVQFLKLLEEDHELEEIMDDISIKLDEITVRYNNNLCNKINNLFLDSIDYLNEQWVDYLNVFGLLIPHIRRHEQEGSEESEESTEEVESSSDEDFKED
jgi:division protein CdvB (Snf7/Vps24/ESCRT-III family)